MKSKIHRYAGAEIEVAFDAARCIHAARCVAGLPAVFDPTARPWVAPGNASGEQIAAVVGQCPTGALSVHPPRDLVEPNVLEVQEDGPIFARGRLRLTKMSGENLVEDQRLALCRCGASENKPLCDNSHRKSGFRAPARLGRPAAEGGTGEEGLLTVRAAPNGPLLLDGPAELRGASSSVHVRKAALCRCGLSQNKPYCDGSHATGGFRDE